jgi:hypothetical protein
MQSRGEIWLIDLTTRKSGDAKEFDLRVASD